MRAKNDAAHPHRRPGGRSVFARQVARAAIELLICLMSTRSTGMPTRTAAVRYRLRFEGDGPRDRSGVPATVGVEWAAPPEGKT
jgi:hypothetical protein